MVKRRLPKPNKQDDSQIMDREWEELVIRFDKKKNDYVFKTACCEGAHVC